jgi:hypothetical protein
LGQSSIPTLNRNGYSMFWLSSWDDLHNYSTNLNEDAFIRSFFYSVVNDKYSSNFYFSKNSVIDFSKKTNFNVLKNTNNTYISDFLYRFNKIPFYISKVRILKFQKWLVVYFYMYNYNKKIIKNNNKFFNTLKFFKKNNFYFLKKNSNFMFDF